MYASAIQSASNEALGVRPGMGREGEGQETHAHVLHSIAERAGAKDYDCVNAPSEPKDGFVHDTTLRKSQAPIESPRG